MGVRFGEHLLISSSTLPGLGRVSAKNVNKLTDFNAAVSTLGDYLLLCNVPLVASKTRCLIITPYLPLYCMGGLDECGSLVSGCDDDGIKPPKYFYCGEGGRRGAIQYHPTHSYLPSTGCHSNTLDPLDGELYIQGQSSTWSPCFVMFFCVS